MNHEPFDTGDEENKSLSDFARALQEFESSRETATPAVGSRVRGRVTEINTEGLEVEIAGLRAFCPVSRVDAEGRIKASMTKLQDRSAEEAFKTYQAGTGEGLKKGPATAMEEALRRAMEDSPKKGTDS